MLVKSYSTQGEVGMISTPKNPQSIDISIDQNKTMYSYSGATTEGNPKINKGVIKTPLAISPKDLKKHSKFYRMGHWTK